MAKLSLRPVKDPIMHPFFCPKIKKDVKHASDTSFLAKNNCSSKGIKVRNRNEANTNLRIQTLVKRKRIRKKETSTKSFTKRAPDSNDNVFDTHVFMVHCDDIMDEELTNDGMINPYWSQSSSPTSTFDCELQLSNDLSAYFPYSSGPAFPYQMKM